MKFTEEEQSKLSKLPTFARFIVGVLVDAIKQIVNDECDEQTLIDTASTIQNNTAGRFADFDLVNYDQAAKILGVSVTNRNKLKALLDRHGIEQVVIHNQKVGFKRHEITALRTKLYK